MAVKSLYEAVAHDLGAIYKSPWEETGKAWLRSGHAVTEKLEMAHHIRIQNLFAIGSTVAESTRADKPRKSRTKEGLSPRPQSRHGPLARYPPVAPIVSPRECLNS
jgi:hypothetical protein